MRVLGDFISRKISMSLSTTPFTGTLSLKASFAFTVTMEKLPTVRNECLDLFSFSLSLLNTTFFCSKLQEKMDTFTFVLVDVTTRDFPAIQLHNHVVVDVRWVLCVTITALKVHKYGDELGFDSASISMNLYSVERKSIRNGSRRLSCLSLFPSISLFLFFSLSFLIFSFCLFSISVKIESRHWSVLKFDLPLLVPLLWLEAKWYF